MEKQKIEDIRLTDSEPPEYVGKIHDILKEADIKDDEYCIVISGKKDGNGINSFPAFCLGRRVDLRIVGDTFFADLMQADMQTGSKQYTVPFLLAASRIIKTLKDKINNIKEYDITTAKRS